MVASPLLVLPPVTSGKLLYPNIRSPYNPLTCMPRYLAESIHKVTQ